MLNGKLFKCQRSLIVKFTHKYFFKCLIRTSAIVQLACTNCIFLFISQFPLIYHFCVNFVIYAAHLKCKPIIVEVMNRFYILLYKLCEMCYKFIKIYSHVVIKSICKLLFIKLKKHVHAYRNKIIGCVTYSSAFHIYIDFKYDTNVYYPNKYPICLRYKG